MALTDGSQTSALPPLLGDKRTRYARTEFCRVWPKADLWSERACRSYRKHLGRPAVSV